MPLNIKSNDVYGRSVELDETALAAIATADQTANVDPVAVWTHFATADEPGDEYFPHQLERCPEEQPQVKSERPAAHVGDIHVQRFAEARVSAGCDLPEACKTLRQEKAFEVVRPEESSLVRDAGPRPNQRHLTAQDVDQLG